jgi:hypothetical protein
MRTAKARALLAASWTAALLAPVAVRADSACVSDAERLCPGIPAGEGRVLTCLRARWSDLSGACQHDIQQAENRSREIATACTGDVWQYCRGVAPGGDRIRVCLWSRWNDLSSTCRDEWARLAEKAQRLVDECAADIQQHCPGLQPGGGRIFLCLKLQESRLSSRCQGALR